MERCDVLVVGAGLAGLECARNIARGGWKVVLADRKKHLHHAVRTTGIFVRKSLEDFAIPEDCLGPAVGRVVLYSPSQKALAVESPKAEFRVGRMGRLYTRRLDECLRAGVTWLPGARYRGGQPCRGGMAVSLDREGLRREILARFLVGADGAASPVARDLRLDANSRFLVGLEEVFASRSQGVPSFHCFLDPRLAPGYIAWVVDDGEEVHVGTAGVAGTFDPTEALENFRGKLPGDLKPQGEPHERRGGRIPAGGVLRRIACPRGLLVGDAAGAVSPLTAGGLDACLRLSAFAAERIGEHLATGNPAALSAYSGANFRTRFASRLFMRRTVEALGAPWAMEAAHALLRTPPGLALARHIFFGRGSFPLPAPVPVPRPSAA